MSPERIISRGVSKVTEKAVIIIPARYNSMRFPGKALIPIAGKSLLRRVWEIAVKVSSAQAVWIATDDERVARHCQTFSADVLMTSASCRNGTERVWEAYQKLERGEYSICVNLQGDAPLTPPWALEALLARMRGDPQCLLATAACVLPEAELGDARRTQREGRAGVVFVVFDKNNRALYFSRSPIPCLREGNGAQSGILYRHIGLYAYRRAALRQWVSLPPTPLEQAESLEQLRALEHGLSLHVVCVDYRGRREWAVDVPGDVAMVEAILKHQGEPDIR